jgi:hypothetical protein
LLPTTFIRVSTDLMGLVRIRKNLMIGLEESRGPDPLGAHKGLLSRSALNGLMNL